MWWVFALLSAFFAALTAIFAKIGVTGVNSDLATAIRTIVILVVAWVIALFSNGLTGLQTNIQSLTKTNILFLILSGLATGFSWIFYFKALQIGKVAQVAPVDKLSVALVIILSIVFLGETVTPKMLIGASFIIVGTIILVLQ
ncbi:hypothetical protein SDC9_134859 [bioreactor metagenome]|uniref:EamA domain-containing protein n=1 Tax=bioreactor metagenome TaxID=1076179 RepID=A0A645DET2_9ZZZZ